MSELRYAPLPQHLRGVKPAKVKLTPLQASVADKLNGMALPFVSKPLVYSKEIWDLPALERKAAFALLMGGALRIYQVYGSSPLTVRKQTGSDASSHYVVERAR